MNTWRGFYVPFTDELIIDALRLPPGTVICGCNGGNGHIHLLVDHPDLPSAGPGSTTRAILYEVGEPSHFVIPDDTSTA